MLLLVLFTLKSIIELYLIQMYIIKIYRYIFTIFFKKISQVVAIASNIEKRYIFFTCFECSPLNFKKKLTFKNILI